MIQMIETIYSHTRAKYSKTRVPEKVVKKVEYPGTRYSTMESLTVPYYQSTGYFPH